MGTPGRPVVSQSVGAFLETLRDSEGRDMYAVDAAREAQRASERKLVELSKELHRQLAASRVPGTAAPTPYDLERMIAPVFEAGVEHGRRLAAIEEGTVQE